VGDPKQLQPYVPQSLREQGFGRSTMERLMDSADNNPTLARSLMAPYIMLEEQFRVAPPLRLVVSSLNYGSRLQDSDVVLQRGPVEAVKLKPYLL
jgi:superfamily I DNA and/or RNA helicase